MAASWIAAIATILQAGNALATKPPTSKLATSGQPQGGPSGAQAQDIFGSQQYWKGLREGTREPLPGVEPAPIDAALGQILASLQPSGGQPPLTSIPGSQEKVSSGVESLLKQQKTGGAGIGTLLGGLGDAAGALAAMGGLLYPETRRDIMTGPVAGGNGGPSLFQLPQRNTLAQILASLPRTM